MVTGARSPEELETLLEDAFVLRDATALCRLFEAGAVLVAGGGLEDARGRGAIARLAAMLWDRDRMYLAGPRRIVQTRDTALVLASGAVNVLRRTDDGSWRYRIALLGSDRGSDSNAG